MYSFLPSEDVMREGERKQATYRDAPVSINDEAVQGRNWVILERYICNSKDEIIHGLSPSEK